MLYRNLVLNYIDSSSAARVLRRAEYLQIVTVEPDKLVPLEFIYDYPLPTKKRPKVCKNAEEGLAAGQCPRSCQPNKTPAPYVCPLGFWGMKKVIERHQFDPTLKQPAYVAAEPLSERDVLSLVGRTLLAASKEVSATERAQLNKDMKLAWQKEVASVQKWADWPTVVQTEKPVLLVVLPHADGADEDLSLEISGDIIESLFIDESYVCGDPDKPPLVFLLGCDVANTANTDAYISHIALFRQAKPALILGTIATVLGADAANVAGKLVKQLANTAKKTNGRFGEVLRQVKRDAVAKSLMVALCLVAYGDADWRLK